MEFVGTLASKKRGLDVRQIHANRGEGSESGVGDLSTITQIDFYELCARLRDVSEPIVGDPMTLTQPEVP
jgi:hypothetical protein